MDVKTIAVYTYDSMGNRNHIATALNKIDMFITNRLGDAQYDTYADEDSIERPMFNKMMGDVRSGKVDVLFVTDLNRLQRVYPDKPESIQRFMEIWNELQTHDVMVIATSMIEDVEGILRS